MVDPATRSAPGFPRISDYALLSDCHTGALVAPDGAVERLCVPQAFTHLALINAISHVIADEQREEEGPARTTAFTEMRRER